jgi:hypothetical protein
LNISTWCIVGLCWVPGHAGVWRKETTKKLSRDGSVQNFVRPEPSFEVSRQNIKRKIKCCVDNKHLVMWCILSSTHRRAEKLISGPSLSTKIDLCSLTGHNLGLLLAFLLDIIPCEDIFTYWADQYFLLWEVLRRGRNLNPHSV